MTPHQLEAVCLSTAPVKVKQLAFAGTMSPHWSSVCGRASDPNWVSKLFQEGPALPRLSSPHLPLTPLGRASLIGQGWDPSRSLGSTFEAGWGRRGSAEEPGSAGADGVWPNSSRDHRPHCSYFLIKMASFPLITKAMSVYFSKIRQARPGKRKN